MVGGIFLADISLIGKAVVLKTTSSRVTGVSVRVLRGALSNVNITEMR